MLEGWAPVLAVVELIPSFGGRFEVTLDGDLLFSKHALGRHARAGEIIAALRERLGPPPLTEG